MGKITSIITFSGKLGNTVGSKGLRGRQLIRARQYDVKNPRSSAQNVQRMIFSTAAVSLAYLTEILNNSFEGKAFGQESLAYARKVNLDLLRNMDPTSAASVGAFLRKGDKFFAPNSYILSQGTLSSPTVDIVSGADYQFKIDGMTAADAVKTASQLFPNIAVGDQITYIGVAAHALSDVDVEDAAYTDVRYCRFAFKDDTTPCLIADGNTFRLNPSAIDLVKAKGDWNKLEFETTEGYVNSTSFHSADTETLAACAILVSNLENNKRSTTRLVVDREFAWKWRGATAYPTYGNVAAESYDFASDIYLNNSARRAAAGSEAGGSLIATIAGGSLPIALGTDQTADFSLTTPASCSSLRLRVRIRSTDYTTDEIIGTHDEAIVLRYNDAEGTSMVGMQIATAPTVSQNGVDFDFTVPGEALVVLGGTAVCDGVTYTF